MEITNFFFFSLILFVVFVIRHDVVDMIKLSD